MFKRKDFVRFKETYKLKNQAKYTIVIATDEGDDYLETDQCLIDYVNHYNTQTEKLFYIGFGHEWLDTEQFSKIKKFKLEYFLYGFFTGHNKTDIPNVEISTIKKLGATLINRTDPHRLKTFSYFLKNQPNMYISMNYNNQRNLGNMSDYFSIWYDQDSKHFSNVPLTEIVKNLPYKNFNESNFDNHKKMIDTFPSAVANHSLFFIVNETYSSLYYTEKSLIPFYFKKIGLWNNLGAMVHLKKIGFDIFDDIVDYSYQYVGPSFKRQDLLLDEFDRLMHLEIVNFSEIKERLNANQKFFLTTLKKKFTIEQAQIFNAIKKYINDK